MTMPQAYEPVKGEKYQLLIKTPYDRAYEHLDYAKDRKELKSLIEEYKMAFGHGYGYRKILLPQKYWNN